MLGADSAGQFCKISQAKLNGAACGARGGGNLGWCRVLHRLASPFVHACVIDFTPLQGIFVWVRPQSIRYSYANVASC